MSAVKNPKDCVKGGFHLPEKLTKRDLGQDTKLIRDCAASGKDFVIEYREGRAEASVLKGYFVSLDLFRDYAAQQNQQQRKIVLQPTTIKALANTGNAPGLFQKGGQNTAYLAAFASPNQSKESAVAGLVFCSPETGGAIKSALFRLVNARPAVKKLNGPYPIRKGLYCDHSGAFTMPRKVMLSSAQDMAVNTGDNTVVYDSHDPKNVLAALPDAWALRLKERLFNGGTNIITPILASDINRRNVSAHLGDIFDRGQMKRVGAKEFGRNTPVIPQYTLADALMTEFLNVSGGDTITGPGNGLSLRYVFNVGVKVDTDFDRHTELRIKRCPHGQTAIVNRALAILAATDKALTIEGRGWRVPADSTRKIKHNKTINPFKFDADMTLSLVLHGAGGIDITDVTLHENTKNSLCRHALAESRAIDLAFAGRSYALEQK